MQKRQNLCSIVYSGNWNLVHNSFLLFKVKSALLSISQHIQDIGLQRNQKSFLAIPQWIRDALQIAKKIFPNLKKKSTTDFFSDTKEDKITKKKKNTECHNVKVKKNSKYFCVQIIKQNLFIISKAVTI